METSDKKPSPDAAPESRFTVSAMTLAADRWMGRLIRFGGVGVVLAVFGMLAFLIFQVFPLFTGAKVAPVGALSVPAAAVAFGEDEYGDFPYVVQADGKVIFQRAKDGSKLLEWSPSLGERRVTAVRSYPRSGLVFLGLSDGSVQELRITYRSTFDAAGKRTVEPAVTALEPVAIGKPGLPCVEVWNAKGPQSRLLLVRQEAAGKPLLTAVRLTERKGLGGKAKVTVSAPFVVAADATSVEKVLLPSTAESLIIIGKTGEVRTYADDGTTFSFLQAFVPFKESRDPAVSAAGMIFGNVSVVFVCRSGEQQVWSMYPQLQPDGKSLRRWGKIHDGEKLAGAGEGVYAAEGNKCYLSVAGGKLQLRNMTTGSLRWEGDAPAGSIRQVAFAGNYDRFTALSADGKLHRWSIVDHHPESSWGAFFGKIWYEGATGPDYTWQSSAGSDEFEAKYSLVPLFYGTVKGTIYALLFALPIALTAAIYVSQFLRPEYKNIVKPVMEIMASLPSVVLGFLAGLWLAPLVDPRLISLFCAIGILASCRVVRRFPLVGAPAAGPPPGEARHGIPLAPAVPRALRLSCLAGRPGRRSRLLHRQGHRERPADRRLPRVVAPDDRRDLRFAQLPRGRFRDGFRGHPDRVHHRRRRAVQRPEFPDLRFPRPRRQPLADRLERRRPHGHLGHRLRYHDRLRPRHR